MFLELAEIFFNVITPVFSLVVIGYFAGPRLGLEARTLSRYAYFILVPAYVFNVMSTSQPEARLALQMLGYIIAVQLACAALGFGVAFFLGRSAQMIGAYVLIAVFANVGNFGIPIIQFRLGEEALTAATLYFIAISTSGFIIGVAAATWNSGGSFGALLSVLKTPAILALIPALVINVTDVPVPLFATRIVQLLAAAMVPTMLITLGVQLASTPKLEFSSDVVIASGIRLIGGAILAILIVIPFGLSGIERGAGIFQASMPAAVLTSIIALEHNLLPDFVTTTVLFSTLASVITLTLLLTFV